MSAPAGSEALSQAANKRFISGVVEGEQTGPDRNWGTQTRNSVAALRINVIGIIG